MAGCERCWSEAGRRMMLLGGDKTDHYHEILDEMREAGRVCTPEEQCGEWHVVLDWKDGTRHCMCGRKTEEGVASAAQEQEQEQAE